jgi:hypothetical protein
MFIGKQAYLTPAQKQPKSSSKKSDTEKLGGLLIPDYWRLSRERDQPASMRANSLLF